MTFHTRASQNTHKQTHYSQQNPKLLYVRPYLAIGYDDIKQQKHIETDRQTYKG